jgi:hypothetical protein
LLAFYWEVAVQRKIVGSTTSEIVLNEEEVGKNGASSSTFRVRMLSNQFSAKKLQQQVPTSRKNLKPEKTPCFSAAIKWIVFATATKV